MSAYPPPILHNDVLNTVFNPNDFINQNDTGEYLPLTGGTISGALNVSALITTTDLRVNNTIIHIGTNSGTSGAGTSSIAIGSSAGQTNLGNNSIAIGVNSVGTGIDSVAIGNGATTSTFATSVAIGKSATCSRASQVSIGTTTSNYRLAGMYANNFIAYKNLVAQTIATAVGQKVIYNVTRSAGDCGIGLNTATGVFTNNNAYSVVCSVSFSVLFSSNSTGERWLFLEVINPSPLSAYNLGFVKVQTSSVASLALSSTCTFSLPSTHTFSVNVLQTSGVNLTLGDALVSNEISMLVF